MFGIKKKIYYITSLILAIGGVTVLGLKIFNVLPNDNVYTLLAIVLLLGGFAIVLRPNMKVMKIVDKLTLKYRQSFYTELTKNCPRNKIDVVSATFEEDENGLIHYQSVVFEELNYYEALKIISILLRDFIMIAYGTVRDKEKKLDKTTIESFNIYIKRKDGKEEVYKLVENYYLNKYKG